MKHLGYTIKKVSGTKVKVICPEGKELTSEMTPSVAKAHIDILHAERVLMTYQISNALQEDQDDHRPKSHQEASIHHHRNTPKR